jgi:capsule polysaccharide modification protein KpsS
LLNAGRTAVEFDLTNYAEHAPAGWQTLIDTLHPPDNGGLVYRDRARITVPDRTLLLLREITSETEPG